jgi:predicted lipid-binding transport protein (Tim44 family)
VRRTHTPTTVIYTAPAVNWPPQNSVLGYFVGVLLAVLVLGALVALITAFAAGVQWLGTLGEGGGRPGTRIERTPPSSPTVQRTRPTTNMEQETTASISEPPPPKETSKETPKAAPESPPTATATATTTATTTPTATATATPTATAYP